MAICKPFDSVVLIVLVGSLPTFALDHLECVRRLSQAEGAIQSYEEEIATLASQLPRLRSHDPLYRKGIETLLLDVYPQPGFEGKILEIKSRHNRMQIYRAIESALARLTPSQLWVVRYHYGLEGVEPKSWSEMAQILGRARAGLQRKVTLAIEALRRPDKHYLLEIYISGKSTPQILPFETLKSMDRATLERQSVLSFELSEYTHHILGYQDIHTIKELTARTRRELLGNEGMSEDRLDEIEKRLKTLGLKLTKYRHEELPHVPKSELKLQHWRILGFSLRTSRLLSEAGFVKIGQIAKKTESDLRQRLGDQATSEIVAKFEWLALPLAEP